MLITQQFSSLTQTIRPPMSGRLLRVGILGWCFHIHAQFNRSVRQRSNIIVKSSVKRNDGIIGIPFALPSYQLFEHPEIPQRVRERHT